MNAKNSKGKKAQNTKSEEQEAQWTDMTDNKTMQEEDKEESEEEYEVEVIVDKMIKKGTVFYKVKWKNYSLDDCTWEPEANLDNCPLKIREYENQLLAKSKEKAAETPKEVPKEAPIKPEIKTEEAKAEDPASQEKKSTKKGASNKPAAGTPTAEPESITGKRDRQQFEEEKAKADDKAVKTKKEKSGKKKNEETVDKDKTSQAKINNKPETHPEADEESVSKMRKLSPKSSGQPESQVTQTKDGSGNIKSINSGTDTSYPPPVKYAPKDISHQTSVEKQQIEKIYDEVFAKAKQGQPAGGKNAASNQNPPSQIQSSTVMLEEKDSKANPSIKGSQQELNKGISLSKIMQDEKLMEMSETESRSEAQENEKKNQGSETSPFDDKGSKSKKKARSEYGALDKGDIPLKVVGIRPVKENKDLEIMISWKTRDDGVKPYNSKVMRIDLLKSGFYMPLIEFYESKMKLEGAPAFDPGMLPKI